MLVQTDLLLSTNLKKCRVFKLFIFVDQQSVTTPGVVVTDQ